MRFIKIQTPKRNPQWTQRAVRMIQRRWARPLILLLQLKRKHLLKTCLDQGQSASRISNTVRCIPSSSIEDNRHNLIMRNIAAFANSEALRKGDREGSQGKGCSVFRDYHNAGANESHEWICEHLTKHR
jgi:hypothetical protein